MPDATAVLAAPAARDPIVFVALSFGLFVLVALGMVFREFGRARASSEKTAATLMAGFERDSERRSKEQAVSAECLQGAIKSMVRDVHEGQREMLERFERARRDELLQRAAMESELHTALQLSTGELARTRQVLERYAGVTNGGASA